MIRLVWAVLCRSSSIDKQSNLLSLFDVAEQVTLLEPIKEAGQAAIPLQIVSLWARARPEEPSKGICRVTLHLPSGKPIGKGNDLQVDLTHFKRLRHVMAFGAFPIQEEGVHEFVLEVQQDGHQAQWSEVARIPYEVEVRPNKA